MRRNAGSKRTSKPSPHEHFRIVAECAPAMLWIGDENGRCVFLNRAQREFWGVDEADVAGFDWNTTLHPEDARTLFGPFSEAMRARAPLQVEARYRRADGEFRILQTRAEPRFSANGDFLGMVGVNTDITEQRAAERTLRIHAQLIEQMSEGVSLATEDGTIVYTNPAEDRMFGYPRGELVGCHVSIQNAYTPTENEAIVSSVIEKLTECGHWTGEWRNRRKDGTEFFSQSTITTVELGGRVNFLCVQRDVTDQKAAIEKERLQERRLQMAMNAAGLGDWLWDTATNQTTLSHRGAELFGILPRQTISWDELVEIIHPDDRDRVRAEADRVQEGPEFYDLEYRVVDPGTGEVRWLVVHGTSEFGPDGAPTGMVGIIRDVTASRLAAERERMLAREVDHRAKNALAVVQSLVRLTPFHGGKDEYVGTVTGRISAMARVHTLLSRNSWEGATIEAILREELAPYETPGRLDIRGPAVHLRLEAAQPISLLIHELTTNAVKYGALSVPSGKISVLWELNGDGEVELEWIESGGPEVQQPASKGFGATLIAGCAGQLGGSVKKDWRRGGLRCAVVIAAPRLGGGQAVERKFRPKNPRSNRLDGSRILIIEDEVLLGMEAALHLATAGATVLGPASTLAGALSAVASTLPDAAVVDLNLGGASADPILHLLRAADIPFVVVTGYDGHGVDAPAILQKPVNHDMLVAELSRQLEQHASPSLRGTSARAQTPIHAAIADPRTGAATPRSTPT